MVLSQILLKLLALVSMVADHYGHWFVSGSYSYPFTIFGRLAYPIFIYLLVQGFRRSRSHFRQFCLLGVSAIASAYPLGLLGDIDHNVLAFFLQLLGLYIIYLKYCKSDSQVYLLTAVSSLWFYFAADYYYFYGFYLFIFFLSEYKSRVVKYSIWIALHLLFAVFNYPWQIFAVPALFLIDFYELSFSRRVVFPDWGKAVFKYFFYIFYPTHLYFIAVLKGVGG